MLGPLRRLPSTWTRLPPVAAAAFWMSICAIAFSAMAVAVRFATATFKQSQIVRYAKQDEVFLDLKSGRLDATLVDVVAGDIGFLKTPAGKGFRFHGPFYTDPAFFGDGAGIAVRKGDDALRTQLNGAIAALRADGSYKKIQDKYFAFDIYGADGAKKP